MSNRIRTLVGVGIGSVWVFHGLFSKILGGIPRHELIVGRILGQEIAGPATMMIGAYEVLLGLWAASGKLRLPCAVVQTLSIIAMNSLEILIARDLLISAPGMVVLNLGFLGVVWFWATSARGR